MKTIRSISNGLKMQYPVDRPVVFIVGPTAVGKTEIAIKIADALHAEIISADSRLFYRGMDIGTAKPLINERVKIRHHLIDVADPDENWSLSVFQKAAMEAIDQVFTKEHLPIVVGGTGQYIRSLIEGWSIPELKPCQPLRSILSNWGDRIGSEELYRKLQIVDPEAASHMDWQNTRRTIRALEVILLTGKRFSELRKKKPLDICYKMIGLTCNREELYKRIGERLEKMLNNGFVEEVRTLLFKGYDPRLPSFSAIGYREIASYIDGSMTLEEATELIKNKTRQFVRRQANWFKSSDQKIKWFKVQPGIDKAIVNFIKNDPNWWCK